MGEAFRIPWWRNNFGDSCASAAYRAILARCVSQGSLTIELERGISEYFGVSNVIATNSGSTALYSLLKCLPIPAGSNVIIQARTWIATLHAPLLAGLNVKLADINPQTHCLDVDSVRELVDERTRVVIVTHMNGRSSSTEALLDLCSKRDIFLIEDAAQAIHSKAENGAFLGTIGYAGVFSLSVAKIISSGQGGLVLTSSNDFGSKVRNFRTHGVESTFEPSEWPAVGSNFRYTDVLASIGLCQFAEIQSRVVHVEKIHSLYFEGLSDVPQMKLLGKNNPAEVQAYVEVCCEDRESLRHFLASRGIESRLFYPPVSEAHYAFKCNADFDIPNARRLCDTGLYLPSGPSIEISSVLETIESIRRFYAVRHRH